MKKIIRPLLVFVLCAALFAGCGRDAAPPEPGGETPTAQIPAGELDMEACLKELAGSAPDEPAAALAERLLENPYFRLFIAESQTPKNGDLTYFPALNESFTGEGLKDSACVWDAFGSHAFVYIFTPQSGADAQAIADAAKNAVDPYWSEEPFDRQLTLVSGGRAFFAMYNDGMAPVTGEIAAKASDFAPMFHAFLRENPDASALETAWYLVSRQKITGMRADAVRPGALTGFGDFEHEAEVTGFAEGAALLPEMNPNPFIGYVFRLDDGADAAAFMKDLKEKANLAWNVCIVTDTVITEADGSTVLFMMYSES